jgi:hypothetical protein
VANDSTSVTSDGARSGCLARKQKADRERWLLTQPFLTLISSQDIGTVGLACVGAGVKKLNIGLGKFSTS